jgi:EB module
MSDHEDIDGLCYKSKISCCIQFSIFVLIKETLEPQMIGDSCANNKQCTEYISPDALCNNGACDCNAGFYPTTDKKKCLKGKTTRANF